jgi:hypothetical protein
MSDQPKDQVHDEGGEEAKLRPEHNPSNDRQVDVIADRHQFQRHADQHERRHDTQQRQPALQIRAT